MRARAKRNGPRAAATARKAKNVGFGKATAPHNPATLLEANAYARAWVTRRCRGQRRWACVIADAAGVMQPPRFLIGQHPERGALWAAIDPNTRFLKAEVGDRRFAAYLAPFTTEEHAKAALIGAGAQNVEVEVRKRGRHG